MISIIGTGSRVFKMGQNLQGFKVDVIWRFQKITISGNYKFGKNANLSGRYQFFMKSANVF